ncbi:hypothetical protein T265_00283 [Opisthorchis viverrini]|uniref:MITD1 C-terminal phospholipase D-like domain-containing protein n=1 Tax=Opisthorchis viverrini TaxID=6198 RepID=A0A075A386_OPIVI|nr:hypothetical protein T265_00283 [Opisthorchis viverrini]KER33826.1 hypothetical protein T265_00283 [Opisthorchis viverrini]
MRRALLNGTQSPLRLQRDQCQCSALIGILDVKLERLSGALEDSDTKNAETWTKVDKELASLNEYPAISIPGPLAAKKILCKCPWLTSASTALSAFVRTETTLSQSPFRHPNGEYIYSPFSVVDTKFFISTHHLQIRADGSAFRVSDYFSCTHFLFWYSPTRVINIRLASYLRSPLRPALMHLIPIPRFYALILSLSSPSNVQKILERADSIQKANPMIRRLSEDRPLVARKLGHSRSGVEAQNRLPLGTNSANRKLMTKLIVVISHCAPGSRPTKPAASPDCSLYSTTTGLSPTKGSDALEKANLTSKQRPNYVEPSALISVGDYTATGMHSSTKPQPMNWTDSDLRGQAAKPSPNSTPSKPASPLMDETVTQDPDNQRHKHNYTHPETPSYIQLATLIAGGSGVHTNTKEQRLQANKPHKIRRVRKLLASFKIENFSHFCEILVRSESPIRNVHLLTGVDTQNPDEQLKKFQLLKSDLWQHRVVFDWVFSDTLHDREIRFDNGWIVKIGRGLDYIRRPAHKFCGLGVHDYDFRPCAATTVDIFHRSSLRVEKDPNR